MDFGQNGLNLLKQCEGCKLDAYQDGGGVWTIGYGTTKNVHQGMSITQDQAESLLLGDLASFIATVNHNASVSLSQNEFDALVKEPSAWASGPEATVRSPSACDCGPEATV